MNKNSMIAMGAFAAVLFGGILGYSIEKRTTLDMFASPSRQISPVEVCLSASNIGTAAVRFGGVMQRLWGEHATWTRLYIVESISHNPGVSETKARLLQNQKDIGDAFAVYYGAPAGRELTALLTEHIGGAAEILDAAIGGDGPRGERAEAAWYANADAIAQFLTAAHPKEFPAPIMKEHLTRHLDLTMREAVSELEGRYAASIADYDTVHADMLAFADVLTLGVVRQFPDMFK